LVLNTGKCIILKQLFL